MLVCGMGRRDIFTKKVRVKERTSPTLPNDYEKKLLLFISY